MTTWRLMIPADACPEITVCVDGDPPITVEVNGAGWTGGLSYKAAIAIASALRLPAPRPELDPELDPEPTEEV